VGLSIRNIENKDLPAILDYWESGTTEYFKCLGVDKNKIPNRQVLAEILQKEVGAEELKYLIAIKDGIPVGCGLIENGDKALFHFHLWGQASRHLGDGPFLAKKMLEKFSDELFLDEIICHISVRNKHAISAANKNGGVFLEEKTIPVGGIYLEHLVKFYSWKPESKKATVRAVFSNLRLVLITIFAGYASKSYPLIDQIFSARISSGHLESQIFVAYIPYICTSFAMVIGYSVLVLLNKNDQPDAQVRTLSGALLLAVAVGAIVSLPFVFWPSLLTDFIGPVAGLTEYTILQALAGILLCSVSVFKYTCIAKRMPQKFLIAEVIGFCLNFFGNWISITFFKDSGTQFIGLAVSTLSVQFAMLLYYIQTFYSNLEMRITYLPKFVSRARHMLAGDSAGILLFMSIPLAYTVLYKWLGNSELTAAYNIGFHMVALLSVPLYALNAIGTAWLSECLNKKNVRIWNIRQKAITWTAIGLMVIPILILLPLTKAGMEFIFGIEGDLNIWVAQVLLASLLLPCFTMSASCAIRVFENPKFLAWSRFVGTYIFGIPIFYFMISNDFLFEGVFLSTFIEVVATAGLTIYYFNKIVGKKMVFNEQNS